MTRHVLALVTLPEIFDLGADAVVDALACGWHAVDVRLRGGYGSTNEDKLQTRHAEDWWPVLERLTGMRLGDRTTWPTYAEALFAVAGHLGIECRGHGWLEARDPAAAAGEAAAVIGAIERHDLAEWSINDEAGVWGRNGSFRRDGYLLLDTHTTALHEGQQTCHISRVGFWSPRWQYRGARDLAWETPPPGRRRYHRVGQMLYGTEWDGKHGVRRMAERGRGEDPGWQGWPEHAGAGLWAPWVGVGRWHDRNGDGQIDPGEIVGSVDTLRRLIDTFAPGEIVHYVGYGAASQLTDGREDYPALASLVPTLIDDQAAGRVLA